MKKLKLYFDTSIFNFALSDDVQEERDATLKLLNEVRRGRYEVYTWILHENEPQTNIRYRKPHYRLIAKVTKSAILTNWVNPSS